MNLKASLQNVTSDIVNLCCSEKVELNLTDQNTRQDELAYLAKRFFAVREASSWNSGPDWVSVSLAMPFIMALYLLIVYMGYNLFCQVKMSDNQTMGNIGNLSPFGSPESRLAAPRTPPPSYSILIGNGDSLFTPPSYRMLFPADTMSSNPFEDITFSSNILINLGDSTSDRPSSSITVDSVLTPNRPMDETKISMDHHIGAIQKTTISYRMEIDKLTVTTIERAFCVRSAFLAKNAWLAKRRQSQLARQNSEQSDQHEEDAYQEQETPPTV